MKHKIRVQLAGRRWRWRCRKGGWVHDLGHADTQPEALAAGLAHLDLYHNDRNAR